MQEGAVPSANFVDASTRSACCSLKSLSKQLMLLNGSYSKREFKQSGPAITKALQQVMTSVRWIQETLTEAALAMNAEMGDTKVDASPSAVVVSEKEYVFLNAVFAEYTEKFATTSREFSLFSRQDVDFTHTVPCQQASDQKSKAS